MMINIKRFYLLQFFHIFLDLYRHRSALRLLYQYTDLSWLPGIAF